MPYGPHTTADRERMLATLGLESRRIGWGQRQMMDGRRGHTDVLVEPTVPDRPDDTVDQHRSFEGSQRGGKQLRVGTEPAPVCMR